MSRRTFLFVLTVLIVLPILTSACNNGSTETHNTNQSTAYPSATPSVNSRINPSNVSNQPPVISGTPPPSESSAISAPPYDPVDDRSEEGIRQNMLAASEDPKISYEQLKKNADRYEGEPWSFTGKIFQIQESDGHTFALVSLDAWGNKTVAVNADFTTDFVEKDQVTVVGYVAENYSYTSVAGWELTVPAIDARAILKPSEAARIKSGRKASKQ